jgi:hypothetical protein
MARIPTLSSGRTVLVLLALNLVFALVLFPMARDWVTGGECPIPCDRLPGLAELQLCFSAERFWHIVEAWSAANPRAVSAFVRGTVMLDFLFPVAYAALLSGLYRWTAGRVGARVWPALALVPWVAAALDYLENVITIGLLLLGRPAELTGGASLAVLTMSTAAALKWTGILASLVLTAVTVLASPFGRVLWICRYGFLSVALGTIPILVVPQGQDILRGLVDVESWIVRAWSLLFLLAWASSVWYWSRVLLTLRLGWEEPPPGLRVWLPRVLGFAACFGFGVACAVASRVAGGFRAGLLVHAGTSVVLGGLFLFGVYKRRAVARSVAEAVGVPIKIPAATETFEWRELRRGTKAAFAVAGVLSLAFLWLFTFSLVATSLGTLSVLFLAAANAVFMGSVTVFLGRLWRLPLVPIALVLAAGFSLWNDNHEVRLATAEPQRPELADAFRDWVQARQGERADEQVIPVVLVAAEGGGLRAAYWTVTALGRIQDRAPDFARHVFAISGVSGGSLGAAVFASLVDRDLSRGGGAQRPLGPCEDKAEPAGPEGYGRFEACSAAALSANFLAPTLARMLASDFVQWFTPIPVASFDRAGALEDSWAVAYSGATGDDPLSRPFLDLRARHPNLVPALVLNVAHVESGRRVIQSPFRFEASLFPDSYDLLAAVGSDLPLKTAVHNSARFAYISPAGRLRARGGAELGHVVDGGYFENSGAVTLLELRRGLARLETPLREAGILRSPIRYHALYLCNNPLRCGHQAAQPGAIDPTAPARVSDLLAPVRTLLATREARGSLALAELASVFAGELTEIGACPLLPQEEKKAPLPLGWQLSEGVRERLRSQLRQCPRDETCGPPCLAARDNEAAVEKIRQVVAP